TMCAGALYDSGGPSGNYGNSENFQHTVYPLPGNYLQVTFNSFNVETCCDRLYIYDGPNTSAPLVGTYTSNPGTILATSSSGSLTFVCISDGSMNCDGWDAFFSCVPMPIDEVELVSFDYPAVFNCSFSNSLQITLANNGLDTLSSAMISVYTGGLTQNIPW